jgi:hypothetical protein
MSTEHLRSAWDPRSTRDLIGFECLRSAQHLRVPSISSALAISRAMTILRSQMHWVSLQWFLVRQTKRSGPPKPCEIGTKWSRFRKNLARAPWGTETITFLLEAPVDCTNTPGAFYIFLIKEQVCGPPRKW